MRPWIRGLAYVFGGLIFAMAIVSATFLGDVPQAIETAFLGITWVGVAWQFRGSKSDAPPPGSPPA
jgi:hypothetical protein